MADQYTLTVKRNTVEPLLKGHHDERPTPLYRPLNNVNLNINILTSTPNKRPPRSKDHISGEKVVASRGVPL